MGIRVDTSSGQIEAVFEKGPAELCGLQAGDRIVSINGATVSEQRRMFSILQTARAGDVLQLTVERPRKDQTPESLQLKLTLKPLELSQFNRTSPSPENSEGDNGVTLRWLDDPASQTMIKALQEQMQRRLDQLPPEIVLERSDLEDEIRQLRKEIESLRAELRERKSAEDEQ